MDRAQIGSMRVQDTTTGIGSPALALRSADWPKDKVVELDTREAAEFRDMLSEWLRERGRE